MTGMIGEGMEVAIPDLHLAQDKARLGDLDDAVASARTAMHDSLSSGRCFWTGFATSVLVEALMQRGSEQDLDEAQTAIDRLASAPAEPGFVLNAITVLRLRTLLAQARADPVGYRQRVHRYHDVANRLGFEGHIAMAKAMT